jgi:predicted secreted protein
MINMKSLKIFLSILILQVSMQAHSNNDALADLVKVILGAKLLEGIAQEFGGESTNQQNYSSDNRVNTSSGNNGSLGYQYYVLGQKSCKSGDYQKALKWFKESKQQGYLRSVENVYKACSGKSVQYSQSEGSLGYQYYRIGKKHCKKGEAQQAIKWFKESRKQGYKWANRAIDGAYSKCRESAERLLSRDKVCSNGVYAESYVDNKCPSINNRWSNNNSSSKMFEVSSGNIENAFNSHRNSNNSKAFISKNIIIKAPKIVENAAIVPVTVEFDSRVESGDKIKLYVNGRLALQVNPKKGSYVDKVSTRVRLEKKNNRIKAKVIRSSGVIEIKVSNKIYADNPVSIPSGSDSSKKHKLREKNGNIKILLKNKMGSGKHIWKIKLASSSGEVFVKLSPLLSKDPYLQIKGNHDNAKLVKNLYGRCNKNYSNSTAEPRCLFEQERWYASSRVVQKEQPSFSDLWGQYGGSILDSNTVRQPNNTNPYSVAETDMQPPVIRFNHSDSLSVNDKQATISGVVKDSSKITEFLIKGKEVAIDENGNFSISRYIRLGRNTFDIVALDAFGNKVTKVITITRQKEVAKNLDKPLDLPSFKGRRDENAVALIIGLDKYETITNAPWAESDAFVFYDYAQQSLGISADRISLITGNQSDRSGIWKSLDRWLPTMVEKNDSNVYVYFAGHGLASADGKEAYLLPYDGDPDMLDRTAIPKQEVIDGLKDLKARSVTLFMDTCYSGTPKGGNGTLVADSRGLRIIKKNSFSALPKNFTIFSAASNDETASSHPTLDNGLFSYWMMRGLGGEADNNNDRKITNGELHKFINKNVKKAAVLMGRKQNSQLVGDVDRVIASW